MVEGDLPPLELSIIKNAERFLSRIARLTYRRTVAKPGAA
jgi:hypothetical protein